MKQVFFILIILSNILPAQNISFVYELKYKPNSDKDSIETEYYYLDVLGKQSVFRSENTRQSDSLMQKNGYLGKQKTNFNQLYTIKNRANMKIVKSITTPLMNDMYHISINDQLNWQILPDKMKIGEMECQKAIVQYGGRNWTAWFSESVPLQEGPYIFYNLPGLIIKISDDTSDYDFILIRTKNSNKNNMFYLRKGKEISWDVYKKLQQGYYSDPFSEIKTRNIKYKVGDTNGNPIDMSLKDLTQSIQKQMRENNNPIELDKAVRYP